MHPHTIYIQLYSDMSQLDNHDKTDDRNTHYHFNCQLENNYYRCWILYCLLMSLSLFLVLLRVCLLGLWHCTCRCCRLNFLLQSMYCLGCKHMRIGRRLHLCGMCLFHPSSIKIGYRLHLHRWSIGFLVWYSVHRNHYN